MSNTEHECCPTRSKSLTANGPDVENEFCDKTNDQIEAPTTQSIQNSPIKISSWASSNNSQGLIGIGRNVINLEGVKMPRKRNEGQRPIFDREELRESINKQILEDSDDTSVQISNITTELILPPQEEPHVSQNYQENGSLCRADHVPNRQCKRKSSNAFSSTHSSQARTLINTECDTDPISPHPYRSSRSPNSYDEKKSLEVYGRSRSPKHLYRSKSPEQFYRSRSPKQFHRSRSPKQFYRSRSPEQFHRSRSPEQFHRGRSPEQFQRNRSPKQFHRSRSPEQFHRNRSPKQFHRSLSPEDIIAIRRKGPSPVIELIRENGRRRERENQERQLVHSSPSSRFRGREHHSHMEGSRIRYS